jgi:competence ComEA-like helix-hairpin-helix protein
MVNGNPFRVLRQATAFWLVGLTLWQSPDFFAQQQRTEDRSEAKWEVLERCRLLTNAVVDGDSFRVQHWGREYVFRLYFVDSPESDATLDERAKDQAAYFGISPKDIPRAAKLASQFTRERLTDKEFTVITRWQNAMGRSRLARFYGIVLVDGKNLAEELVANGQARIYGLRANWPDGPRSSTFINQLKNLEIKAREQKRGVWDETRFPLQTGAGAGSENFASTNVPVSVSATPSLIDVNSASYEELQKLPRIGPKLAERIIAHRPYKNLDDLDKVPGIGPETMKQLRPLITVGPVAP